MLKREILDQEREYKNQIAAFETKAHEQWVTLEFEYSSLNFPRRRSMAYYIRNDFFLFQLGGRATTRATLGGSQG